MQFFLQEIFLMKKYSKKEYQFKTTKRKCKKWEK